MLAPGGFFASNTSTLPISGLAQASRAAGELHRPALLLAGGQDAAGRDHQGQEDLAETLARAYDYVLQIGKTPIVVNDSRGFFTSRTFGTFVQEGCAMLAEGIPAAVIENAARLAGMPVGPLAVIDETSMSLSVARDGADQRRPGGRGQDDASAARPGCDRAHGEGVQAPGPRGAAAASTSIRRRGRSSSGRTWRSTSAETASSCDIEELKDRILYRQAIETARCLRGRRADHVHDANIGSIFGIGFPAWTGGALQYVNHVGVEKFVARADELAKKYGERFAPPQAAARQRGEGRSALA